MGTFIHKNRVAFSDTDMAGIVHFSNFFRYAEIAESALFRSIDEPLIDLEHAKGWPRVSASFDYLEPLCFDDAFETHLTILRLGMSSISWQVEIRIDGVLLASGSMTTIYCAASDEGFTKVAIPAALKLKLESFVST